MDKKHEWLRWAWLCLILVSLIFPAGGKVAAQAENTQGPVYIVQQGDTLWDIAQRFGVDWRALAEANGISDPGTLSAGDELIIPGLEGITGVLVTEAIPFGENLRSLSRRYQVSDDVLARLNHLTSPAELYRGEALVVPQTSSEVLASERIGLAKGESILEMAAIEGINPWEVVRANRLEGSWSALPGDVLQLPKEGVEPGPGALPGVITALEISPEKLLQGKTTVIRLKSNDDLTAEGTFLGNELHFFQDENKDYVAMQGIHAMKEPGLHTVVLHGKLADGTPFGFSQRVSIGAGDFVYENLTVPSETIDPENTKPEDETWNNLAKPVTPEKLWQGIFQSPVTQPSPCGYTDYFGNRRSYNGSAYNYFHTGLDFCYNYNLDVNKIYAPADGVVVFAGPMVVRGNATMLDHGWGVYTGYMHQAEILVKVGDRVKAGQVIGIAGETGRVNGPHLHFEVWVNGVQVDPLDWLERAFP